MLLDLLDNPDFNDYRKLLDKAIDKAQGQLAVLTEYGELRSEQGNLRGLRTANKLIEDECNKAAAIKRENDDVAFNFGKH